MRGEEREASPQSKGGGRTGDRERWGRRRRGKQEESKAKEHEKGRKKEALVHRLTCRWWKAQNCSQRGLEGDGASVRMSIGDRS